MRQLLITAAVAGTVLTAMPPAEAKSIWLKCGTQELNLDSSKERFSLTRGDKLYQGHAIFNPGQIDFELQSFDMPGGGGVKHSYSINRKSLEYTKTDLLNYSVPGLKDTGWKPVKSSGEFPNPKVGKCLIMKTPPTAGNQI